MIDTAFYLDRPYPNPPCWALVTDLYRREFDLPVDTYAVVNGSLREAARLFSMRLVTDAHGFSRRDRPSEGDVVLMGTSVRAGIHHAGVYTEGRVLHALPSGTYLEELGAIQDRFALVEFWGRNG